MLEPPSPSRIFGGEPTTPPSLYPEERGRIGALGYPGGDFAARSGRMMKRSNSAELLADPEERVFDEFELADARRERLPKNSPFVGTFHRGIAASNAQIPTFDMDPGKLPASCPYVGTVNHAVRSGLDVCSDVAKPLRCAEDSDVSEFSEELSGAATPPQNSPPQGGRQSANVPPLRCDMEEPGVGPCGGTDELPDDDAPMPLAGARLACSVDSPSFDSRLPSWSPTKMRSNRGRGRRTHSFTDILDCQAQSPELMGMQAILPRHSGLRIINKLGEGSFGKVALALNSKNKQHWDDAHKHRHLYRCPPEGTQLVLKCVKKASAPLELIRNEVVIHAQCEHPNIPTLFGHYEDDHDVIMILEFIAGQELRSYLKARRTVPEPEALVLAVQLFRALAHMHERGFVHRDISPANIMVTDEARLYLIDFGLAIDLAVPNPPAAPVGTLGYISPELVRGEAPALAVDVWAAGCVLYETVFGFSPFLPQDLHTAEPVQFPDPTWGLECSAELCSGLTAMLAKNAKERCSAAEALCAPWATTAATLGTVAALFPDLAVSAGGRVSAGAGKEQLCEECIAVDLRVAKQLAVPQEPRAANGASGGRRAMSDLGETEPADGAVELQSCGESANQFFMATVVSSQQWGCVGQDSEKDAFFDLLLGACPSGTATARHEPQPMALDDDSDGFTFAS